jgi:transposase
VKKFKRYKVGSSLNVRIDVLDIIKEDHLARQIEGYVSQLNTSQIESKYSKSGQNAFHPKMMLSVILYGYSQGIRSGRKLATSCNENLAFIYLSKNEHPQKSAINDFRKDNYKHFESFFLQILQMMDQTEVGNFDLSMADGSKVGANSSKKRTKNKEQFKKWKDKLREDIGEIEQELLIAKSSGEKQRKKKEVERKTELEKKIEKMMDDLEEEESDK